jgi:hypothetical protein
MGGGIDDHRNLADRRVFEKVHRAIRGSRAVLVCISSMFDDSLWCRAEYLPSLRARVVTRVIACIMEPEVSVPPDLKWVPRFNLYVEGELEALVRWLRAANGLPADLDAMKADDAAASGSGAWRRRGRRSALAGSSAVNPAHRWRTRRGQRYSTS